MRDHFTYIAVWDNKRGANFEDSFKDIDTNDNRISRMEAGVRDHLQQFLIS